MRRIPARLLIALLTFSIGIAAFSIWLYLRSPRPTLLAPRHATQIISAPYVISDQEQHVSSRYANPAIDDGLFYVARSLDGYILDPQDGYDERALVLSYDDKPIEIKTDDPAALTLPGLYLSNKLRFDFERVEVIGKKVHFKTRNVRGISYEFSGISGEEILPTVDPKTPVPFIKGILTMSRDGKVEEESEIIFRHAVTS